MPVVEATLVATPSDTTQLATDIAKAMEDAILQCHAEGMFAPQVIKERMMAAQEAVVAAYDEAHTPE